MASNDLPENRDCDINGNPEVKWVSECESNNTNMSIKKKFNFFTRWFKCFKSIKPSLEENNDEIDSSDTESTESYHIDGTEIDWDSKLEEERMDRESNYRKSNFFTRCIKRSSNAVVDTNMEDKIKNLRKKMDDTIEELKESKLYHEVHHLCNNILEFRINLNRVLLLSSSSSSYNDENSKMPIVIYALGSIESSYSSRYQLALAILLGRDFPDWINGIESYDPETSDIDAKVMEYYECKVLSENEECSRKIENPALFYMPYALFESKANLLKANWKDPCCLNQMILLTNGFEDTMEYVRELDDEYQRKPTFCRPHEDPETYYEVREYIDCIEAIQKYTTELSITSQVDSYSSPFHEFSFHFFNLDPDLDMDTLLDAVSGREMRIRQGRRNKLQKFLEVVLNSCHICQS